MIRSGPSLTPPPGGRAFSMSAALAKDSRYNSCIPGSRCAVDKNSAILSCVSHETANATGGGSSRARRTPGPASCGGAALGCPQGRRAPWHWHFKQAKAQHQRLAGCLPGALQRRRGRGGRHMQRQGCVRRRLRGVYGGGVRSAAPRCPTSAGSAPDSSVEMRMPRCSRVGPAWGLRTWHLPPQETGDLRGQSKVLSLAASCKARPVKADSRLKVPAQAPQSWWPVACQGLYPPPPPSRGPLGDVL